MENKAGKVPSIRTKNKVILWIVIFIIIVLIGFIYASKDSLFSVNDKNNNGNVSNLCFDSNLIEIITDNVDDLDNIKRYYSYSYSTDNGFKYAESVYREGSLLASEMIDSARFTFAFELSNLTSLLDENDCYVYVDGEINTYIDEEIMKEVFESVFGKDSYVQIDSFDVGCIPYYYDSSSKRYIADLSGCGGAIAVQVDELITDIDITDTEVLITTAIVIRESSFYYKDYDETIMIGDNELSSYTKTDEWENVSIDIESYIKDNYTNLEQYTYTFKIVDGNYNYQGVTRTQELK